MSLQKAGLRSAHGDLVSFSALAAMMALAALLPACGAPPAGDLDLGEAAALSEQADPILGPVKGHDACASVRCKDGFVCEAQNGSPACVPAPPPECQTDDDCSLVASYCGDCTCSAAPSGEIEPKCVEGEVACAVWPCLGLTASCQAGTCVLAGEL
ncbi:hypothetical protein [Sorangium sp. So ce542]|uniref:hypothetical protein n=1 Tax=Sorangium sp. So ce542 TaxID=3133316 RepID=UPI003F5E1E55